MQAGVVWRKLFTRKHLHEHYYEKVACSPSVGLDKITPKNFEKDLDENISLILKKASDGTYTFTRYRQLLFLKGPNKIPRQVCVPTIRDKLTLSVLNELLCEVFGISCKTPMPHSVIHEISSNLYRFNSFLKIDVSSFYASIPHEPLFKKLRRKIRKTEIMQLIQNAIETEALYDPAGQKKRSRRTKGLPEGLSISNALANIYLADIDSKFQEDRRIQYFRYVDDILILVNKDDQDDIEKMITGELSKLGLETNEKTDRGPINRGFEYLGYFLSPVGATVRNSSKLKFERSLEELIAKLKDEPQEYAEWKLNLKITGFIYNDHKYGWVFFYSQITDVSLLYHFDDLVKKLLVRYKMDSSVKTKRYVRTYHEIKQALHTTTYVPNFDRYTIDDKRQIVARVYKINAAVLKDPEVEKKFNNIISREIRDIEKDIQGFS